MTAAHRQRACSSGNIIRGYPIRVVLETTALATEEGLAFTVLPGGMSAAGALLTGVPGVYGHHPHPLQSRLVLQQRAEAGVGPEVVQMPGLLYWQNESPEVREAMTEKMIREAVERVWRRLSSTTLPLSDAFDDCSS